MKFYVSNKNIQPELIQQCQIGVLTLFKESDLRM